MAEINPELIKAYIESFKGQLRTQSLNGGRKGPGEEFGSGGNYWTRENWESYVERTKSTLVGMGADADELDALIKRLPQM